MIKIILFIMLKTFRFAYIYVKYAMILIAYRRLIFKNVIWNYLLSLWEELTHNNRWQRFKAMRNQTQQAARSHKL